MDADRPKAVPGVDIPGEPQSEGRFTAPTDECPHPDRWTSTDGDSTEVEVSDLAYGLVRALQPSLCVETGSGFGQTTERILAAIRANGHGEFVSIEPDLDRVAWTTRRLGTDRQVVLPVESLSWTPTDQIDFAWLDSLYELRVPEFNTYRPWMRVGCIVCFHDSAPGHGSHRIASGLDLRSEVEKELAGQVRMVHLPTPRGLTVAEVLP